MSCWSVATARAILDLRLTADQAALALSDITLRRGGLNAEVLIGVWSNGLEFTYDANNGAVTVRDASRAQANATTAAIKETLRTWALNTIAQAIAQVATVTEYQLNESGLMLAVETQ
jgi:hypothetical protein